MSDHEELDGLRAGLDTWRARLDELRLRAHLGGMELKDKLREAGETLEPAYRDAQDRLTRIAQGGAEEARTLAHSLKAGWEALQRTHRDLLQESERERKAEWDERRHS